MHFQAAACPAMKQERICSPHTHVPAACYSRNSLIKHAEQLRSVVGGSAAAAATWHTPYWGLHPLKPRITSEIQYLLDEKQVTGTSLNCVTRVETH